MRLRLVALALALVLTACHPSPPLVQPADLQGDAAPPTDPPACAAGALAGASSQSVCGSLFLVGHPGTACIACPAAIGCVVVSAGTYCVVGGCADPRCAP